MLLITKYLWISLGVIFVTDAAPLNFQITTIVPGGQNFLDWLINWATSNGLHNLDPSTMINIKIEASFVVGEPHINFLGGNNTLNYNYNPKNGSHGDKIALFYIPGEYQINALMKSLGGGKTIMNNVMFVSNEVEIDFSMTGITVKDKHNSSRDAHLSWGSNFNNIYDKVNLHHELFPDGHVVHINVNGTKNNALYHMSFKVYYHQTESWLNIILSEGQHSYMSGFIGWVKEYTILPNNGSTVLTSGLQGACGINQQQGEGLLVTYLINQNSGEAFWLYNPETNDDVFMAKFSLYEVTSLQDFSLN